MLSEKIRAYWKRIPFVWKSFLIYVPLFATVFTFFLFVALIEIKANTTERAKNKILIKVEKIKTYFNAYESEDIVEDYQIIIFSSEGVPLVENVRFYHIDPKIKLNKFQFINNGKVLVYNTFYQSNGSLFYIQIVKDMVSEYLVITTLKDFFILIIFSGLFISAALSIPLTKLSLKGIRTMAETAKQISYENLSKRIPIQGSGDEFDVLALTLNQMIDGIQISADAQKKFVSNASHELRTPIAVIKGYAQLLSRWGHKDEKVQKEASDAINKEVELIQNLLDDLLLMSRIDSKLSDLSVILINVRDLMKDIMKDNKILFPNREFSFIVEKVGNFNIWGDRWLIKALIRIFTDNANKYSPSDKLINYCIDLTPNTLILSIIDHGHGIPDEHKQKVFERFYRVDEARTREKGGSGLGMAIAKRIISLHDGDVSILNTPEGGTTINLVFPNTNEGDEKIL